MPLSGGLAETQARWAAHWQHHLVQEGDNMTVPSPGLGAVPRPGFLGELGESHATHRLSLVSSTELRHQCDGVGAGVGMEGGMWAPQACRWLERGVGRPAMGYVNPWEILHRPSAGHMPGTGRSTLQAQSCSPRDTNWPSLLPSVNPPLPHLMSHSPLLHTAADLSAFPASSSRHRPSYPARLPPCPFARLLSGSP